VAVAAAAAALARAHPRFATPINAALPPPLHALPQEGAVPRTSLDGGDAAENAVARGRARSGSHAEARARGDRARRGAGVAQAMGAARAPLPQERARGKARRGRPHSAPHWGWFGGPPDARAPPAPRDNVPPPHEPQDALAAATWDPQQGLSWGASAAFGRPGTGAAPGSAGGGAAAARHPGIPVVGTSRSAAPRILPPRTYGAALAQLAAFSAAARPQPQPAGGKAATGLEYLAVSSRKGGIYAV
jgi:hypothetical protein